jgi:hypothetical protein
VQRVGFPSAEIRFVSASAAATRSVRGAPGSGGVERARDQELGLARDDPMDTIGCTKSQILEAQLNFFPEGI